MKNKKSLIKELFTYLIIIVAVLLVKTFLFANVLVHGSSMEKTLYDKDVMILNKIGIKLHGIKRFDIVVINSERSKIIKRVIGLPGETVAYKDNKLYINGEEVKDENGNGITSDIDVIKLGENQYYVLGDNRTNSVDSRILGPIDKNKILGHATFIIYPFNRMGIK